MKSKEKTNFTSAIKDFFLKEKDVCIDELAYMKMPDEKEKYNLSNIRGSMNIVEGRYKIKSEADAIVDDFLSMSLP